MRRYSPELTRRVVFGLAIGVVINILAIVPSWAFFYDYGPKPKASCGWDMRHWVPQDPGEKFNRALEWKKYGVNARYPAPGVIVIWAKRNGRGHVGVITSKADGDKWLWTVKSGNDGGMVRERPRSVKYAVAFRGIER